MLLRKLGVSPCPHKDSCRVAPGQTQATTPARGKRRQRHATKDLPLGSLPAITAGEGRAAPTTSWRLAGEEEEEEEASRAATGLGSRGRRQVESCCLEQEPWLGHGEPWHLRENRASGKTGIQFTE